MQFFPSRQVALELLGFQIHWYGLMYLFAFLLAFLLLPRLQKYRKLELSNDDWSSVVAWSVVGVIVGGRLGYVLFYEPAYFVKHPLEILAVWNGGMASHGGFIGVAVSLWIWCQRKKVSILRLTDTALVPIAIGLALGRIGNFINGELYGPVSTFAWALEFPGVEGLRHPTQLYAVCKNLLIAGVCLWGLKSWKRLKPGQLTGVFLMLYGVLRFLVEYVRIPSHELVELGTIVFTRGQSLSVLVIVFGMILWIIARKN